jgi:choline dehydrogenase-like flavoprotein
MPAFLHIPAPRRPSRSERTGVVDVVVIGGGVVGAAAAWQLAGRGREVVLLERFVAHGAVVAVRAHSADLLLGGLVVLPALRVMQERHTHTGSRSRRSRRSCAGCRSTWPPSCQGSTTGCLKPVAAVHTARLAGSGPT